MMITANELLALGWITLGVIISTFISPSVDYLYKKNQTRGIDTITLWETLKPYLNRFFASLVVGIVILATSIAANVDISTWWLAFLVGFGSDRVVSVLQGFKK